MSFLRKVAVGDDSEMYVCQRKLCDLTGLFAKILREQQLDTVQMIEICIGKEKN